MKKHHFNVFNIDELNDAIDDIIATRDTIKEIKTQGYWSYGYDLPDQATQNATAKLDNMLDDVYELLDDIRGGFVNALAEA